MKHILSFLGLLSLLAVTGCCCTPSTAGGVLPHKIERWKQLADQDEADVVPWSQTVRFPSRDEWGNISRRAGTP